MFRKRKRQIHRSLGNPHRKSGQDSSWKSDVRRSPDPRPRHNAHTEVTMNPETKRIVGTFSIMLGLMILALPLSGWRRCHHGPIINTSMCIDEGMGMCAPAGCVQTEYQQGHCIPFGTGCAITDITVPAEDRYGTCIPRIIGCECSIYLIQPSSATIESC